MRRILSIMLTALALLPAYGQAAADTAIRHTHVYLNIRSGPATSYEVIGQARPCTPIAVIEAAGKWYKIEHGGGEGYVAGWYTHKGQPHCGDAPAPAQQPAQSGASSPQPAPAATAEPQDNKCFGAWTWCSAGSPDVNKFWWNLGWCMAGIDGGTIHQTPSECMGLLGTPLPSNFNIPGASANGATTTVNGSSTNGGSGSNRRIGRQGTYDDGGDNISIPFDPCTHPLGCDTGNSDE